MSRIEGSFQTEHASSVLLATLIIKAETQQFPPYAGVRGEYSSDHFEIQKSSLSIVQGLLSAF